MSRKCNSESWNLYSHVNVTSIQCPGSMKVSGYFAQIVSHVHTHAHTHTHTHTHTHARTHTHTLTHITPTHMHKLQYTRDKCKVNPLTSRTLITSRHFLYSIMKVNFAQITITCTIVYFMNTHIICFLYLFFAHTYMHGHKHSYKVRNIIV